MATTPKRQTRSRTALFSAR